MRFHCILDKSPEPPAIGYLRAACERRGVEFAIDDYSEGMAESLGPDDLLYRTSVTQRAKAREQRLLMKNPKTFYRANEFGIRQWSSLGKEAMKEYRGIPMPRTFYGLAADRRTLREQVEALGGYPIVFKVLGGQEWQGVMLVDSERALFSLADYFAAHTPEILLMQYVPATSSARLVVVWDRVVASVEYVAPSGDFRSNLPYAQDEDLSKRRIPRAFSQEAQDVAIRLAHACGFEFGGVDLLLHEDRIYALEINMPCNFADTQEATDIDVAGAMVEHLMNKTQRFGALD